MNKSFGYNSTSGGIGNYTVIPENKSTREKKSAAQLGNKNSFYGMHHKKETRAKFSTPVVSYTDDGVYKYYASQKAVDNDGYHQSHVTNCVNGKAMTHGRTGTGIRLKWRFATDDETFLLKTMFIIDGSTIITPKQYDEFLKEVSEVADRIA